MHLSLSRMGLLAASTILILISPNSATLVLKPRANDTTAYVAPNINPNITGTVKTLGFRINEPYPGNWDPNDLSANEEPHGWTLRINASANVPMPRGPERKDRITLELQPPTPLELSPLDANDQWDVPMNISNTWSISLITFGTGKRVSAGNGPKGECPSELISQECMDDIRKNIVTDQRVVSGDGSPRGILSNGARCDPVNAVQIQGPISMNQNFTRQTTSLWEWDVDEGNYDKFGGNTFALAVVWGHSNGTTGSLSNDHVTFACVKADQKTDASQWPSYGVVLSVPSKYLVLLMAVGAIFTSNWAAFLH